MLLVNRSPTNRRATTAPPPPPRPPDFLQQMDQLISRFNTAVGGVNDFLWANWVLYTLVLVGVLFTVWSFFGQWRALTHGVKVVAGKYDDKNDPGAISHFQALSTALSATVGLGNIGGVAVAVNLGGPGAVFWMWVIGTVGMALKMTEVTQSMIFRNTDDPQNPHGGPMYVAKNGFAKWGFPRLGFAVGVLFVVTLLISAITGGNMFQAWNVADITENYFQVPRLLTGSILALGTAAVIIGGIKSIGRVAGAIVPFMCVLYLVAAVWVIAHELPQIPAMLKLITLDGLGLNSGPGGAAPPERAFLGGTVGYAMLWGIKRALFSSEAGQGSAPIAHSAARTDEPVREGVVAGLEPFIDTIVVCTLTALVILGTGTYNREAETNYDAAQVSVVPKLDANDVQAVEGGLPQWTISAPPLPEKEVEARRVQRLGTGAPSWRAGETILMIVQGDANPDTGRELRRVTGEVQAQNPDGSWPVAWGSVGSVKTPVLPGQDMGQRAGAVYGDYTGATLTGHAFDRVTPGLGKWLVTLACWLFAFSTIISWNYYGEQGMVFVFGDNKLVILGYRLVYCLCVILACWPAIIPDETGLDNITTLGTGVMLWVNIPLMLIFGATAMTAYRSYFRRLKRGEL